MLKSMIIAFSMYSKIPMPRVEWNEKNMRYSLCFFPLVGLVTGACSLGCFCGMSALGFSRPAVAAVLTVVPILINGGIHMDGLLDTMDAKSSYKPAQEKLQILKDPHTGAFAVIYGLVYLFLCFGMFCEVTGREMGCIALGYAYSRMLSGLSVTTLKKARKDGMAAASAGAADRRVKWILAAELAVCGSCFLCLQPAYGTVCLLAGGLSFLYYRHMAYRTFGGITGDLAGYFLQLCELLMLIGVVTAQKLLQLLSF